MWPIVVHFAFSLQERKSHAGWERRERGGRGWREGEGGEGKRDMGYSLTC